MGAYINPPNESKEHFLKKEGIPFVPGQVIVEKDFLPVCLVNSGPFTAAGIAFDKREMETFMRPDGRQKKWYLVPISKLHPVCPELAGYLKRGE